MTRARSILFGVPLLVVACGGTASTGRVGALGKPVAVFPSRQDLETVAAREVRPRPSVEMVEVERWDLQTPVPALGARYEVTGVLDSLLKEEVEKQSGRLVLSPALACAARESARFYVEHGAYPSDGLQRYLAARCGSTVPRPLLLALGGPVPNGVSDERVQREQATEFKALLAALPKSLAEVGLGYTRGKSSAVVVVIAGEQRARLDGFSPLLSGNVALLEGEAPSEAVFGVALVNQGDHGVAYCDADRAVRRPRFRFTCPVLPSDRQAHIEVATRKADQVLLSPILSLLVRRSDADGLTYSALIPDDGPGDGAPATAQKPQPFERRVLSALNGIRQKGGLRPVTLDLAQSKVNARVAPHWFEAMFGNDDATAQTVALGLLAGWEVQGTIRDGGIYAGYLSSSKSPRLWLSYALESPLARWVLLQPETARIAFGSDALGGGGLIGVVTAYSFFESQSHDAEENAVFEELARMRLARRIPAPQRVAKPPELERALAGIASNQVSTEAAFDEALYAVRDEYHLTVGGWIVETNDLKQLSFSEELLLKPGPLNVSIGVTHYKVPGAAWGQYVVLFMTAEAPGAPTKQATRSGAPRVGSTRVPPALRAVF